MSKEYTLYKGDKILAFGTITELAKQMGVKKRTIQYYGKPSYLKKREKSKLGNYRSLVKIDD